MIGLDAAAPVVALDGCTIRRPCGFAGGVEIVMTRSIPRAFPTHVSEGLGLCLKLGVAHAVTSNGKAQTYPADSLCVRAPGCVWSCEAAPVGFLSVDIALPLLPEDIGRQSMRFLPLPTGLDLPGMLTRLDSDDALLREQTLVELVLAVVDCGAVACARSVTADAPLQRARERLRTDLEHALSLDELARDVGVNKFVLIRRFRAQTGTTPHHYRTLLRVERAREQLARGIPASEVAHALGFADQAHLSRAFKRTLGVTPSAYARSAQRTSAQREQDL
jgi:AraC family chemosensory pili system transcriptional regulator ChpD